MLDNNRFGQELFVHIEFWLWCYVLNTMIDV